MGNSWELDPTYLVQYSGLQSADLRAAILAEPGLLKITRVPTCEKNSLWSMIIQSLSERTASLVDQLPDVGVN